jgi:hypothetical protein
MFRPLNSSVFILRPAFLVPTLFWILVYVSWSRQGILFSPPLDADAVFFEIVASNLASQSDFSGTINQDVLSMFKGTDIIDSLQRGPGTYAEELRSLGIDGINAYRPPLFPFLLSLPYRLFGQSFLWAKILNLTFITFGMSMLISAAVKIGDLRLGWIVGILALTDPLNVTFSSLALSEALAFFGLAFLVRGVAFGSELNKCPISWGVQFGLLALVRSICSLWAPILLIALRPSIKSSIKFLLALIIVLAPWAIRNSLYLKTFAPLGSQGGVVLGMVFGDKALERSGNWNQEAHNEFIAGASALPIEERERYIMQHGQKKAWDWIKTHPGLLPTLFLKRISSLWWNDAMPQQRFLVIFSFLCLIISLREPWVRILLIFCVAHTVSIGLMGNAAREHGEFSLYGRYLYTLQPALLLLSAHGISKGAEIFTTWLKKKD